METLLRDIRHAIRSLSRTRQAVSLAIAGGILGLTISAIASRLLSGLLFQTAPTDLATYLAVGSTLVATAAVASYVPARRAARVDPYDHAPR